MVLSIIVGVAQGSAEIKEKYDAEFQARHEAQVKSLEAAPYQGTAGPQAQRLREMLSGEQPQKKDLPGPEHQKGPILLPPSSGRKGVVKAPLPEGATRKDAPP